MTATFQHDHDVGPDGWQRSSGFQPAESSPDSSSATSTASAPPSSAVLAGGLVLGTVQALVGGIAPGSAFAGRLATAAGLGAGLAVGASAVGYRTDRIQPGGDGRNLRRRCRARPGVRCSDARRRPVAVDLGHPGAVGDRLADHVAGDRRRRAPPRGLRLVGCAVRERRRRHPRRLPVAPPRDASVTSPATVLAAGAS